MRNRRVLLLTTVVCTVACALWQPAHSDDDAPISLDARPPQLLVLVDGTVLHGQVSERPGGYLIQGSEGQRVFPLQMIRLTASSLTDAYAKQRDAMKKPTASDHLELAQWCFENKQYAFANEQLAAALKLEPERSDARRLLQEIANQTQEDSLSSGLLPSERGARQPLDRTAAGISSDAQAEFIRRVQPILVNRCGNASCHGSASPTAFKLANVRTGHRQQRLETEANLAAVLRLINAANPAASALLSHPQNTESRAHRGLFTGPSGAIQRQSLQEWVAKIANESPQTQPAVADRSGGNPAFAAQADFTFDPERPSTDSEIRQAGGGIEDSSPLLIEIPRTAIPTARMPASPDSNGKTISPKQTATETAENRSAFLKRILDQDRPDAFDPNEFNRKVHGGTRPR